MKTERNTKVSSKFPKNSVLKSLITKNGVKKSTTGYTSADFKPKGAYGKKTQKDTVRITLPLGEWH